MIFKEAQKYKTENQMWNAHDYLASALNRMVPSLEKITGYEIDITESHKSIFSKYIRFLNPDDYTVEYVCRVSDHSNGLEGLYEEDIRICGKCWREVKSEILDFAHKIRFLDDTIAEMIAENKKEEN